MVDNAWETRSFYDSGRWAITSAPGTEPLTRTEAKNYLKVASSVTADDTLIDGLIVAARNIAQGYTGRLLITQTVTEKRDDFTQFDSFPLRWGPVTSVTSVTYTDTAGNSQTLATTVYGTSLYDIPARLFLKSGQVWPDLYDQRDVVTVVYVAGYANAAAVPDELKAAMYMLIADMYENRTDYVKKMPTAAEYLMDHHRVKLF